MNIVGVEFDRSKFDTTCACEEYLRHQDDLSYLLDRKTFRLKSTISRFISDESRNIWSWYELWQCKGIKVERPIPYVVILRRIGDGHWDKTEIPIPLESTQEKRKKLELLRQKKEVHKKEVAEKMKLKRKKSSPSKEKQDKPKKKKKKVIVLEPPTDLDQESVAERLVRESETAEPLTNGIEPVVEA